MGIDVQHIIGMPLHIIMTGMPMAIMFIIISQQLFIISICEGSMGIILQTMPSLLISQVMRHIIMGIIGMPFIIGIPFIMGMPPIIGIMPFIMGIPFIMGMPPIIGIPPIMPFIIGMPPIIGIMPFIIGMPPIWGIIPFIIGIIGCCIIGCCMAGIMALLLVDRCKDAGRCTRYLPRRRPTRVCCDVPRARVAIVNGARACFRPL